MRMGNFDGEKELHHTLVTLTYPSSLSTSMKQSLQLSWNMYAESGTPVSHLNGQMHPKQFSGGLSDHCWRGYTQRKPLCS